MNYTTILIERRIADLMSEHDRIISVLKGDRPEVDIQRAIDRIKKEILTHESFMYLFKDMSPIEMEETDHSMPCVAITNKKRTEYSSVKEAALQLNLDTNKIMTAIKHKTNCSGYYFELSKE